MFRSKSQLTQLLLSLACHVWLSSCGASADDTENFNELDRLRVLALRSTPADLVPGESAVLDVLVYEPDGRDLEYEWSWCPARGDESTGFECTIAEKDMQRAWRQIGSDTEFPGYDLGSEPTAAFPHVFTAEFLQALCGSLSLDAPEPEAALLACLYAMQPSVSLTVRTSKEKVTALKNLVLLSDTTASEERNRNPDFAGDVALVDLVDDSPITTGTMQAGHSYRVTTEVALSNAQEFVSPDMRDEVVPSARREQLTMSWFITNGSQVNPDDEAGAFGDDPGPTTFVEGRNEIASLGKTGRKLPLTAGPEDAQLFMVLRDERGGVGWATQSFHVKESK